MFPGTNTTVFPSRGLKSRKKQNDVKKFSFNLADAQIFSLQYGKSRKKGMSQGPTIKCQSLLSKVQS
jgi:hypothetical protein